MHSITKHIDIQYHFIRDHILKGDIELHFIPIQYQLADIFTKPLDELTFKRLIVELEEKPERPIPFEPATQVGFDIGEIIFNPNNEVALLYLPHTNSDYFKVVPDFISKCCLRKAFTRTPNQYKEYLSEFWYTAKALKNSTVWFLTPSGGILDEVEVNTFRNAIEAHYFAHSSEYVEPHSIEIVRQWFLIIRVNIDYARLIWEDLISKLDKKTRERVVPYPRFLSMLLEHEIEGYGNDGVTLNLTQVFSVPNWARKKSQPDGPPFIDHMLAICNVEKPVAIKAPKTSLKDKKKVPKGTKPGAKYRHRRKQIPVLYNHPQSKIEATKGVSSSKGDLDPNPSQPPTSTPVVAGMYNEFASRHDASAASTAKADLGKFDPNDSVSHQQEKSKFSSEGLEIEEFNTSSDISSSDDIKKEIKQEDLSKLMENVDVDFMDLDSPKDDQLINVQEDEDEEVNAKKDGAKQVHAEEPKETEDASADKEEEVDAETVWFKAQPSYPNLKELPSKFNDLSGEIKELKKYVEKLKVELPRDLKEIPTKLEKFTSTVSSIQAKIKTLDALLSLLSKVTKALHRFAKAVEKASHKAGDQGVPSADQAANLNQQPKPTTPETTTIIPPIITSTTTQFQSPFLSSSPKSPPQPEGELIKKDKGKKAVSSKDAGKEGEHIHLTTDQIKEQKRLEETAKAEMAKKEEEVVKEELIDLLGFDVVTGFYKANLQCDKYCDKMLNIRVQSKSQIVMFVQTEKARWSAIYEKIKKRMDYLHKTKAELEIDFSKPFSEQDPLDKLNDLARKNRKHVDDIHDYFRSTKKFKSSVQYEDHPAWTVLNNPCLEIFFRLYQGHVIDDHARTFSFFLLAKVGKRNLNLLKQMRTIKKLR
ncbi:hypothetical protein Tco_0025507 [Tanacetum coccineum]